MKRAASPPITDGTPDPSGGRCNQRNLDLTQDCLGWDESGNLDLRQMAEKATPTGAQKNSRSEDEIFGIFSRLESLDQPKASDPTPRKRNTITRKRPRSTGARIAASEGSLAGGVPLCSSASVSSTPSPAVKTDDGLAFLRNLQSKLPPTPSCKSPQPNSVSGTTTNLGAKRYNLRTPPPAHLGAGPHHAQRTCRVTQRHSYPPKSTRSTKPTQSSTVNNTVVLTEEDNNDDEFGDLQLDLADLESIELSATQAMAQISSSSSPQNPDFIQREVISSSVAPGPTRPVTKDETVVSVEELWGKRGTAIKVPSLASSNKLVASTSRFPEPNITKENKENAPAILAKKRQSDEFENLDLSFDDFDAIDSMVKNATTVTESKPGAVNPTTQHQQMPPPSSVTNTSGSDLDMEELPDIDFDALDEVVVAAEKGESNVATVPNGSEPPPRQSPVHNPRVVANETCDVQYLTFTRYKVLNVRDSVQTYTKTLSVAAWQNEMLADDNLKSMHRRDNRSKAKQVTNQNWPVAAYLHLRGEWYHTRVDVGDVIHVCSLQGQFRTDASPLVLDTTPPQGSMEDDLVLIVHPDMLLTPTGISETVSCSRRAVIKNRLGSTGITDKAPLFGTMRHELFEHVMKTKDFSASSAQACIQKIVRDHAEDVLACGATTRECEGEIFKVLPQLQQFASDFTEFGTQHPSNSGHQLAKLENNGYGPSFRILAKSIEAVEEPIISTELGLKGNVDMILNALTLTDGMVQPALSILGVELKTGHNQKTQNAHMAQLIMYSLMMRAKYGSKRNENKSVPAAIGSAMLLYMNSESFRAVHVEPMLGEIKSLIGQRNVVAIESRRASLPRGVVLSYDNEDDSGKCKQRVKLLDPTPVALPELLQSDFSCKKCYSVRDCMMYERTSMPTDGSTIASHSHKTLLNKFTGQLTELDLAYFQKWDRLLDLEIHASNSLIAESWLASSSEREQTTGKCMSGMVFQASSAIGDENESNKVLLEFARSQETSNMKSLDGLSFEKGCHVVVSVDCTSVGAPFTNEMKIKRHMHIIRGFLHNVTEKHISVVGGSDDAERIAKVLHRRSGKPGISPVKFRLDRDDVAAGIGTLRQNLIKLFTADMHMDELEQNIDFRLRMGRLRDCLVRLETPSFDSSASSRLFSPPAPVAGVLGCDLTDLAIEFADLNSDQRAAVEKVFCANQFALIQGLPGTGKTSTVSFIIRLLVAHGKRVLVSSYTHAAVDNVLLKLISAGVSCDKNQTHSLIRVGKISACHQGVHPILVENVASHYEGGNGASPAAESLRRSVSSAKVVGITTISAPRSPILVGQHFDFVIVDEAGQISQPAILGALMTADKFVLVGDHMQLPPLVTSEVAELGGYGESMLKRLADNQPSAISPLTFQYRMHEDICQLSNDIVYKGSLKCGNEDVRYRKLNLSGYPQCLGHNTNSWLGAAMDPHRAVVFIDTDDIESRSNRSKFRPLEHTHGNRNGGSIVNESEVGLIKQLIQSFLACGATPESIGVLCPFRAQLRLLDETTYIHEQKAHGLELSTIDRFQGRDKQIIILSFVRSNEKGRVGRLLEDFRRLNVAITRAKCKLVMVGSFSTLLTGSEALRPVLHRVRESNQIVQLPPTALLQSDRS